MSSWIILTLGQPAPSTDGNSRCPAPFTDGYCGGENLRGIDTPVIKSAGFVARSGGVHEHTRSSRFKFNVIWHQFSTSQFPRHQFGKFVQVSSGNWGQVPPFCSVHSVHSRILSTLVRMTRLARSGPSSVQFVEFQIVWEEQRSSSRYGSGGRVVRALASSACAVMRGVWVRAPSPLGHAALHATEGIGDMMFNIWL